MHTLSVDRPAFDTIRFYRTNCSCGWQTAATFRRAAQLQAAEAHLVAAWNERLGQALLDASEAGVLLDVAAWMTDNPRPDALEVAALLSELQINT